MVLIRAMFSFISVFNSAGSAGAFKVVALSDLQHVQLHVTYSVHRVVLQIALLIENKIKIAISIISEALAESNKVNNYYS